MLAAASTAWQRGDTRAALVQLREAWRLSLDPALADVHEQLSRLARAPAIEGRSVDERASAWLRRAERGAGDPSELRPLLDEAWHPGTPELERLHALSPWTPDPSLASALAARLRAPRCPQDLPGHEQLTIETIRLLAAQKDRRALALLEPMATHPGLGSAERRQLRSAIASLEALVPRRLDAAAEQAMAPLLRAVEGTRAQQRRGAALLAELLADPDDDLPRYVYADWLTSHGDVRGEFITLQLERHARAAPAQARELELLARHAHEWSEPLHAVLGLSGRSFERGFLAAASVEAPRMDASLAADPAWSTLRSLDGHVSQLLVERGPLARLRRLYGFLDLDRFVWLRTNGRLEAVEHFECSLADPNLRFDRELGLRSLLVRRAFDEQLVALLGSPAVTGLEEFAVYYDGGALDGRAWVGDHRERPSLARRLELLFERLPSAIERLRLIDGRSSRASRPEGCELCFERDAAGVFSRLRLRVHPGPRVEAPALVELLAPVELGRLDQLELEIMSTEACDAEALAVVLAERGAPIELSARRA